jgi:hypothetical protein
MFGKSAYFCSERAIPKASAGKATKTFRQGSNPWRIYHECTEKPMYKGFWLKIGRK